MRILLAALLVVAAVGCRGTSTRQRDYASLNRSSLSFLRETFKQDARMRHESLARTLDWRPRALESRRRARESRRFALESFFKDEGENWRKMIARVGEELSFDREEFARRARFGLLDSGD